VLAIDTSLVRLIIRILEFIAGRRILGQETHFTEKSVMVATSPCTSL